MAKKKTTAKIPGPRLPGPTKQQGWIQEEIAKLTEHRRELIQLNDLMDDPNVRNAIALYRKLYKVIES